MPNIISRLFVGKTRLNVADFPSFVAALAARWRPDSVFVPIGQPAEFPDASVGGACALYRSSDRPEAIVIAPDESCRNALTALVRAALDFLAPSAPPLRSLDLPVSVLRPEWRDSRVFAATAPAAWLLFEADAETAFADRLAEYGPLKLGEAVAAVFDAAAESGAAAEPGPVAETPAGWLTVAEPWAACASRLLFPAVGRAGDTLLRFTPRSYGLAAGDQAASAPGAAVDPAGLDQETWFRFGLKSESLALSGFWAFSRPPAIDPSRFAAFAVSVAKTAGRALADAAKTYAPLGAVAGAAAPVDRPKLGPTPVFELQGSLAVGNSRFAVRAIVPAAYPLKLASLFGRTETDPIAAQLFLDRVLAAVRGEEAIEERAVEFQKGPAGGAAAASATFVPFYELLDVAADADYRKLVQNFLIRHCGHAELAELLFYRKTTLVDGSPLSVVVRPPAVDLERLVAVLPDAVRESFVAAVREGGSASSVEDFLARNEAVYDAAAADLRRGSLELGSRTADLIGSVFARYVYPRKRRRLDAMIREDYPFAVLRGSPPRIFRAVIDGSDFRTIGAALIGHADALKEIAKWCSRRKQAEIRAELSRTEALLERGAVDVDELCALRAAMIKKLEAIQERDKKESELADGRARRRRNNESR